MLTPLMFCILNHLLERQRGRKKMLQRVHVHIIQYKMQPERKKDNDGVLDEEPENNRAAGCKSPHHTACHHLHMSSQHHLILGVSGQLMAAQTGSNSPIRTLSVRAM